MMPSECVKICEYQSNELIEKISSIKVDSEDALIIREEKIKSAEDMKKILDMLMDCITNYNKATLIAQHKMLEEYSDILSAEDKKRYVETFMGSTLI